MLANQKSIAVLPFHNISSDAENEYFADGITEELINSLSKIDGLKVTARTSSFVYKNKTEDVRLIGNTLGVSTVLEGSIRKAGNRVRITAQLIRTDSGFHIWSENFDRKLTDIFELQDEISLLIADKIRENFGHIEIDDHLVQAKTDNIEAYQQFLKGRFYQLNWKLEDFSRAIDCYQLSIKLDPSFHQAYFGIVQCYGILASWNFSDREQAIEKTNDYLKKGLELEPECPEAYFALATRDFWVYWRPYAGLTHLQKALAIAPNNSDCLESSAECYTALGLFEPAMTHIDKALEINPLSANHCYTKGNIYYLQGQFQEAITWMKKALEIDPKWDLAIKVTATCHILQKNKAALLHLLEQTPDTPNADSLLALYDARNEDHVVDPADFGVDHTGYLPWEVYIPLYTGNTEAAITALQSGIDRQIGQYINFINDPFLEPLREHPTFQKLQRETFPPLTQTTSEEPAPPTKSLRLSKGEIAHFEEALQRAMVEEHAYLNPNLSLRSLAEQIDLHPNKLSWLLNDIIGRNFSEYINHYRLSAFQEKAPLPEFQHLTILGLAYECGFNSKSVFNEFFKKSTGKTPSAWLKANK